MSDASIGVKIGAEYAVAVAGIKAVETAATSLGTSIKQVGDKFAFTNNTLNQSSAYAKQQAIAMKQAAIAIQNVVPAANDAAGAIDKIGGSSRGILEPVNNAYNAIRKIAYVLPGIGISGIFALAFEGISATVATFTGKLDKETDSTKKADDAAKEFAKTLDSLKGASDIIAQASGGEAGTIQKVNALAAAVRDTNLSYKERENALNDLKKINESYFGDLTLEQGSLAILASRVREYSQAIIQEAVIKGFTEEISKQTIEYNKQIDALDVLKKKFDDAQKAQSAFSPVVVQAGGRGGGTGTSQAALEQNKLAATVNLTRDAFEDQRKKVENLGTSIAKLNGNIDDAVSAQLKLRPLEISPVVKIKDPKVEDTKIKFNGVKFQLDLSTSDISIDTTSGLPKHIDKTFLGQIQDQLVASLGAGPTKEFQKRVDNFKQAIANDVVGLGEGIFEDLGKAFAGTKNPFANILYLLGGFLEDFGKQLIVLGGLSQLIQDLLPEIFTPGGALAAIAIGALSIAVGAGIKALSSKKGVTAFAEGGIVTGPTNALIGEAGPEVVFPLDKLNKFIRANGSSPNMNVSGQFVLRNQDLVLAVQRGTKNQSYVS
jgi:uncharacterized coiled-coil protein SlyX